MDEKEKFLGIMGLIALRKTELYNQIISKLEKKRRLTDLNKNKIKDIIAKMENNRFFSKEEISDKKIINSLSVREIYPDISQIIEEIKLKLQRE